MIYTTIRPDYCKIVKVENLSEEMKVVALHVGAEENTTVTCALVNEAGTIYAYSDDEAKLETYRIALTAIIHEMTT